ncbi:putative RNA-binding protein EEED8.10 [Centruroides sculpturatus]|uniref:putative RNA-binding protein EEED8.10 n=1 Tax=Centruroides sculpturatus TaxID=218467 RepID=UPI000C6EC1A8|nr:putative RNA-binding protein EEED8.10 [Centruroides sculpturatus]
MLGFRFSYLYKLHSESFMGLNVVCLPGTNPPGAVYRSSLPATPVSTPIRENGRFSEAALRERLCRTPSPRKCRLFESRVSEPDLGFNALDTAWPLSPDDDDDKSDNSDSTATITQNKERYFVEEDVKKPLSRRVFVGNISYRVTRKQLKEYFSQFGKVTDCVIVQDHIRRRPRGYGFVTFAKGEDAEKVRNSSPEFFELDSRRLRIFPADEKRTTRLQNEAQSLFDQDQYDTEDDDTSESTSMSGNIGSKIEHINDFNDDVLIIIFSYLELKERVKIERVCKRWKSVCLKMWHSQHELHFKNMFSIFKGSFLTNAILSSLLKKCSSHLKILDLYSASHVLDYRALEIIAQFCPNLEVINMSGVKATNVSIHQLAKKCPNLKKVILQKCLEIGENGIWWLLHLCKSLEYLDVTENIRLTGQCFHMAGSKIQTVILNGCSKLSPVGFSKIATKCSHLSSLHLNNCSQLTDGALELLCQVIYMYWKHLTGCSLSCEKYLTGSTLSVTASGLHHIGRLSNLEELSLAHNYAVDDDVVYSICHGCRKIRQLTNILVVDALMVLSILVDVTASGLHHIGRLSNLEELSLAHNYAVDDDVVYSICHGCRKIRFLNLSECYHGITDASLSALSNCNYLKTLYISYLDKITNEGISAIARQGQLETLQCRGCPNLGDTGFVTLAVLCPDLKSLDVSGCILVTNITVQACYDSILARTDHQTLTVIVGETSSDPDILNLDHPNLIVSKMSYCQYHLRPDRFDFVGQAAPDSDEDSENEDDPDLIRGMESGGGSWQVTEEILQDFLENDDPSAYNEWEAPF